MELIAKQRLIPSKIITHRLPSEDIPSAYLRLKQMILLAIYSYRVRVRFHIYNR